MPKGYQISQYDLPMSADGCLEISDPKERFEPKRVRIIRAHLEEDAGKSLHDEVAGKADSLIDLNRTGTPLLEIVTEPDLRSSAEAKAFLKELRLLLTYIGVSDCNMQEGSLRVDANVNLHIDTPKGKVATPIVEIKNMNSFRAVERALDYEAERQYREWQETGRDAGRGAEADPRLGRCGRRHPRPAEQGRIERLPLLSRTPTWCRSRSRRPKSPRSEDVARRVAGRAARAAGIGLRPVGLRCRRAGEPRSAGRRLLPGSGRCAARTARRPAIG